MRYQEWRVAAPSRAAREELEQAVWFSDHPIEEAQRQQAQKLLEGTERLWRERVPAARRWKQRFLTCQVI